MVDAIGTVVSIVKGISQQIEKFHEYKDELEDVKVIIEQVKTVVLKRTTNAQDETMNSLVKCLTDVSGVFAAMLNCGRMGKVFRMINPQHYLYELSKHKKKLINLVHVMTLSATLDTRDALQKSAAAAENEPFVPSRLIGDDNARAFWVTHFGAQADSIPFSKFLEAFRSAHGSLVDLSDPDDCRLLREKLVGGVSAAAGGVSGGSGTGGVMSGVGDYKISVYDYSNFTEESGGILPAVAGLLKSIRDHPQVHVVGQFSESSDGGPYNARKVLSLLGQPIVQIACGSFHLLALSVKGEVLGLGMNENGQTGTPISAAPWHYEAKQVVGLKGRNIVRVFAGAKTSAALTDEGEFLTWGENSGHGKATCVFTPRVLKLPTDRQGDVVRGFCGSEKLNAILMESGDVFLVPAQGTPRPFQKPEIFGNRKIVQALCSDSTLAFLLEDGAFYIGGTQNACRGELGIGEDACGTAEHVIDVNEFFQPKFPSYESSKKIVYASIESTGSAVVDDQGRVYTWGSGFGLQWEQNYVPKLVDVDGFDKKRAKQVSVCGEGIVALTEDNEVWTWGANPCSRLNDCTTLSKLTFPLQLTSLTADSRGNKLPPVRELAVNALCTFFLLAEESGGGDFPEIEIPATPPPIGVVPPVAPPEAPVASVTVETLQKELEMLRAEFKAMQQSGGVSTATPSAAPAKSKTCVVS